MMIPSSLTSIIIILISFIYDNDDNDDNSDDNDNNDNNDNDDVICIVIRISWYILDIDGIFEYHCMYDYYCIRIRILFII